MLDETTALWQAESQLDAEAIQLAREHPSNFIELVGRDIDTRDPVTGEMAALVQRPLHERMQELLLKRFWLAYMGFPGLGKTTQVALYLLWCLGHDPNHRYIFCSHHIRRGDPALKLSQMMLSYLAMPLVQQVFPGLRLGRTTSAWNWELAGREIASDPTVRTKQLRGDATGARPTKIVFDDLYSDIASEAESRQILSWIDKMIARFGIQTDVQVIWLTNHWHDRDPVVLLAERERKERQDGRESLWHIEDVPLVDAEDRCLHPDIVPQSQIPHLKRRVGDKWPQLYKHETQEEAKRSFSAQVLDVAFRDDVEELESIEFDDELTERRFRSRFVVVGSVDPAGGEKRRAGKGDRFALTIHLGSLSSDLERLLWVESDRIPVNDAAMRVLELEQLYHVDEWVFENNGVQGWFQRVVDLQYDLRRANLALRGEEFDWRRPVLTTHNTGRNKHDSAVGVAAMAAEMKAGRHKIPSTSRQRRCLEALVRLRDGLRSYSPSSHTADEAMAYWFGSTKLKELRARARRLQAATTPVASSPRAIEFESLRRFIRLDNPFAVG